MEPGAPSDVRTWAREQGLTSAVRGPLPRAVLEAYAAAHPGATPGASRRRRSAAPAASAPSAPAASAPALSAPAAASPLPSPAPAAASGPSAREAALERRVDQLETQLGQALSRLLALERRPGSRSLLGLRLTL